MGTFRSALILQASSSSLHFFFLLDFRSKIRGIHTDSDFDHQKTTKEKTVVDSDKGFAVHLITLDLRTVEQCWMIFGLQTIPEIGENRLKISEESAPGYSQDVTPPPRPPVAA